MEQIRIIGFKSNSESDRESKSECPAPRSLHLRFGIIITNYKQSRFVIARVDFVDYPLVFHREQREDINGGYECYSLYKAAMTVSEADEILNLLKSNDKRRADAGLRKYFKPEGALCVHVGECLLDDAVPDAWYDSWKQMEALITFLRDYPGYYEVDFIEGGV